MKQVSAPNCKHFISKQDFETCTTFLSPVEGVLTQSLTRCCENAL